MFIHHQGMGDDATTYAQQAGVCLSSDESGYVSCPTGSLPGTVLTNVAPGMVAAPTSSISGTAMLVIAAVVVTVLVASSR
jgi:hypothetical protein